MDNSLDGDELHELKPCSSSGNNTSNRNQASSFLRSLSTVQFFIDEEDLDAANKSTLSSAQVSTIDSRRRSSLVEQLSYKSCLRPNYTLRTQLFLSFGVLATLSVVLFSGISITTSYIAGDQVQQEATRNLDAWIDDNIVIASSKYVADSVDAKLEVLEGLASFVKQVTLDRFRGYPNHKGYLEDTLTPFLDYFNETQWKYPLDLQQNSLLPLDSDLPQTHITAENAEIHVGPERVGAYGNFSTLRLSTETATIFVPDRVKCTDCNNSYSTLSSTFDTIHYRVSQFATPLLKALYEFHTNLQFIGVYFVNDGYGAPVSFPALKFAEHLSYTSIGCDWLRSENPLDSNKTIGTEEQIARCRKNGTSVPLRDYNPLERGWCRFQAMHPDRITAYGPYEDAFTTKAIITFGRPIYDDLTKELVACVLLDVSLLRTTEFMQEISTIPTGAIASVRWVDGVVLGAHPWENLRARDKIWDLKEFVDKQTFMTMIRDWDDTYHGSKNTPRSRVYKTRQGKRAAFQVSPAPPKTYDPLFRPGTMVLMTIDESVPATSLNLLRSKVDKSTNRLMRNTLIGGLIGLICVLLMLYVVAQFLTHPLEWMHRVGNEIMTQHFGAHTNSNRFLSRNSDSNRTLKDGSVDLDSFPWSYKYAPKTEIIKLLDQFRKMVKKFSGVGTAKLFKRQVLEVQNPFLLYSTFQNLYLSRKDKAFAYDYTREHEHSPKQQLEQGHALSRERRLHWGYNSHPWEATTSRHTLSRLPIEKIEERSSLKSPLFRWILWSITIPLLLTLVTILGYVVWEIAASLPSLIDDVEQAHIALEKTMLGTIAGLRAHYLSELMSIPIRDLHVLTRFLSWMHFGAITLANDTMPSLLMLTEECKTSPEFECPAFQMNNSTRCDCRWNDPWPQETCEDIPEDNVRIWQRAYFTGLRENAWPDGTRNFTTYPPFGTFPNTTQFWSSIDSLPGAPPEGMPLGQEGSFQTTFDRVRVLSAASMILIPSYNYGIELSHPSWGSYVGYDADGSFGGYSGCESGHAFYAHFQSTVDNGAASLNGNLCPLEKYGYDARCRDWFVTGKQKAIRDEDPLYVTPPYEFAAIGTSGVSASLPLMNDDDFVGQTLVDLSLEKTLQVLNNQQTPLAEDGFHLLITANRDTSAGNTLVGPGFTITDGSSPVESLVMKDPCSTDNEVMPDSEFHRIVEDMEAGGASTASFLRTQCGKEQNVTIAYAPVKVSVFRFVDPGNIAGGAIQHNSTIYSVALAETDDGLNITFRASRDPIAKIVYIAMAILLALIGLTLAAIIYIASRVSMSITHPTSKLLVLVIGVNREDIDIDEDELPEITGGSIEVTQVRETFEKLFTMVRFATSTFYSGDIYGAWKSFEEASMLFKKLNNHKALGIANNDLGCIALAIYRTMQKTQVPKLVGMTRAELIDKAYQYFKDTIDTGEADLARINEEEGWSIDYLIFMQQLSNRYFNRAMFLLTSKNDHPDPQHAESQGLTDLATCRDMDREVVDNGDREGFKGDLNEYFELLLSRIKGVLNLIQLGYDDEWGLEELFADARKALLGALDEPRHALFRNMEPAGQMQRLDAALIEYYTHKNQVQEAARVAIRMLVEDEYVIGEAASWALKALIDGLKDIDLDGTDDPSDVQSKLYSYKSIISEAISLQFSKKDEVRRASYHACNAGDFTMEFF